MNSRSRRLVLAAFAVLVPLAMAPAKAWAQPSNNTVKLFGATSPFLTSAALPAPSRLDLGPADQQSPPPPPPKPTPRSEGFGIGAKIGPIFNSLSGGNVSYSTRAGLEGGIWFGGNRGGTVGVMGEFLYAVLRTTSAGSTLTAHYLEIPILLRINIGGKSKNEFSFYILAGEVNDIKLKSSLNGVNVSSQYQGLNIGMLFGGGFEFARFLVELRENIGLRSVANVGGGNGSIKTKAFAILVGFRFN